MKIIFLTCLFLTFVAGITGLLGSTKPKTPKTTLPAVSNLPVVSDSNEAVDDLPVVSVSSVPTNSSVVVDLPASEDFVLVDIVSDILQGLQEFVAGLVKAANAVVNDKSITGTLASSINKLQALLLKLVKAIVSIVARILTDFGVGGKLVSTLTGLLGVTAPLTGAFSGLGETLGGVLG
ncbi:hypothetical protein Bhyg_08658 [Pseudolycoriella hygida]|uniref:Uncharacterized protein n=1 Tax=Pseudolycoriella hygida TaxID=35572 RepID=A0A9Q0S4J3_9DIPT|nr:hypothetical protein Bhyg_08658 [Pseudolycoriella hygida]